MRLLGGGLVAGAGVWVGLLAARELRRSAALCRDLCGMLELMDFELSRFRTPLPELFSSLAEQLAGPPGELCEAAAAGLSARDRRFGEVWSAAVLCVPEAEREILLPLGSVLGSFGAEEQAAGIAAAAERMRLLEAERRMALRDRTRLCVGLFSTGGVLLAVLLM